MTNPDPWTSRAEPNLPDPGQPENKQDDPVWNKVGAVSMGICVVAITLTLCAILLHVIGVGSF